ncbi:hypothetical protein Patl1_35267 [Pistacia atlantica]|nr:hypothetical protein Patl1_35267 [Pistacia atlantica]
MDLTTPNTPAKTSSTTEKLMPTTQKPLTSSSKELTITPSGSSKRSTRYYLVDESAAKMLKDICFG